MSAHTPGPWLLWDGTAEVHAGPFTENTPGLLRGGRGQICEATERSEDEVQLANAKLIAAAPELADALAKLVEQCVEEDVDQTLVECRAALRKAGRIQ